MASMLLKTFTFFLICFSSMFWCVFSRAFSMVQHDSDWFSARHEIHGSFTFLHALFISCEMNGTASLDIWPSGCTATEVATFFSSSPSAWPCEQLPRLSSLLYLGWPRMQRPKHGRALLDSPVALPMSKWSWDMLYMLYKLIIQVIYYNYRLYNVV